MQTYQLVITSIFVGATAVVAIGGWYTKSTQVALAAGALATVGLVVVIILGLVDPKGANDTSGNVQTARLIPQTRRLIRVFPFFNETSIVRLQLESCRGYFSDVIVIESTVSHVGKPHELTFPYEEMQNAFPELSILYVVLNDEDLQLLPSDDYKAKAWKRDTNQKVVGMQRGLERMAARNGDLVLISDADEIFRHSAVNAAVAKIQSATDQVSFTMPAKHWYFRQFNITWPETFVPCAAMFMVDTNYTIEERNKHFLPSGSAAKSSNNAIKKYNHVVDNAGWHLSYFGKTQRSEKVLNFADSAGRESSPSVELKDLTDEKHPSSEVAAHGHGNKHWSDRPELPDACVLVPHLCTEHLLA